MKLLNGSILMLPLLFNVIYINYRHIEFDIHCAGNIKRAADANTVEIAKKELKTVLDYLEYYRMTEGYTSILWKGPEEDVGFWYNNIKSAYLELEKVKETTSQLEKTNILLKLRETLLDRNDITVPPGIVFFPYNVLFCFLNIIFLFLFCIGGFCILLYFKN